VKAEDFLEHVKAYDKTKITNDYTEVIEWLMMIYENPSYEVSDDEYKVIIDAHTTTKKLDEIIETNEIKLKEKRVEQEGKLVDQKNKFVENLKEIKREVEGFKEKDDIGQRKENNDEIAELNKRLLDAAQEKVEINDQEETIGFEVTEYNEVEELQQKIKPFDELWSLYQHYYVETTKWKNNSFCTLDPEEVEKDHKRMLQTSNKLKNVFEKNKLPNPYKVADNVNKNLMDWRKYLPIIQVVCTKGLKDDRHWPKILDICSAANVDSKENVNFRSLEFIYKVPSSYFILYRVHLMISRKLLIVWKKLQIQQPKSIKMKQ
jgi:coenzyme F420-reducing hydrogenase delta subunit